MNQKLEAVLHILGRIGNVITFPGRVPFMLVDTFKDRITHGQPTGRIGPAQIGKRGGKDGIGIANIPLRQFKAFEKAAKNSFPYTIFRPKPKNMDENVMIGYPRNQTEFLTDFLKSNHLQGELHPYPGVSQPIKIGVEKSLESLENPIEAKRESVEKSRPEVSALERISVREELESAKKLCETKGKAIPSLEEINLSDR